MTNESLEKIRFDMTQGDNGLKIKVANLETEVEALKKRPIGGGGEV